MTMTHHRSWILSGSIALVILGTGCSEGDKVAPKKEDSKTTASPSSEEPDETVADTAGETGAAESTDPPEATMPAPVDTTPMVWFGFDTNDEGFALQDYKPSKPMYTNLFYTCAAMDENSADTCKDTTVTWTEVPDPAEGADPGMLELKIPFSGYDQSVELQKNLSTSLNLTNKFLKVRVWADAEGYTPDAMCPGGGYIFVKTGEGYDYSHGAWQNFEFDVRGSWIDFTMDMGLPDPFEGWDEKKYLPSDVRAVGIQISTGAGCETAAAPTPGVFHVDHFTTQGIE